LKFIVGCALRTLQKIGTFLSFPRSSWERLSWNAEAFRMRSHISVGTITTINA